MFLGELIKEYRTKNNLSMEEFGRLIGKSKAYISMLEKNKNSRSGNPISPSMDTFQSVAKVFNVTLDELLQSLDDEQAINIDKSNSSSQTGYYTDPAINEYAEQLRTNPNMRLLFDATKDMSKEDIDYVVDLVTRLKGREP